MDAPLPNAFVLHRAELLRFARVLTKDLALAEDVVQTVGEASVAHGDELRDAASARAWLFRVARNAAIGELDRRRRLVPTETIDVEDTRAPEEPPCACVLAQAKRLPTSYQAILDLVDVEGTSVAAAAEQLGITPNNASVRLLRARSALRTRLERHCGTRRARACTACGCEERGCCAG